MEDKRNEVFPGTLELLVLTRRARRQSVSEEAESQRTSGLIARFLKPKEEVS